MLGVSSAAPDLHEHESLAGEFEQAHFHSRDPSGCEA